MEYKEITILGLLSGLKFRFGGEINNFHRFYSFSSSIKTLGCVP